MPQGEFETATNMFFSWLQQRGVKMSPKALLVDRSAHGRGRGLVAKGDFEYDEVIFTIPRKVVLNIENAASTRISAAALADMPKWLALTAVMMMEMLQGDSQWLPYLAVLPLKFDTLIFWSSGELAELQASSVLQKIDKDSAEAMFNEHISVLGIPGATVEVFHRTASIVMAYAFDIPRQSCKSDEESCSSKESYLGDEDQETVMAMVPLADMLNADADANNAHLICDTEHLEMRTVKPIQTGQEIYNDYGPLPRSALLRCYGYVADSYAPYDVVELSMTFIISALQGSLLPNEESSPAKKLQQQDMEARIEFAKREGVFEDSYDINRRSLDESCIPTELIALIFILLVDMDAFSSMQFSQKSLPSRSEMATVFVGSVMKNLLHMRESSYETTLEEDDILLEAGTSPHRRVMAIKVRQGEKMVLREAIMEAASFQGNNNRMRTRGVKRMTSGQPPNSPKKTKAK